MLLKNFRSWGKKLVKLIKFTYRKRDKYTDTKADDIQQQKQHSSWKFWE